MRVTKNLNKVVRGASALSLGISIVVAIAIGVFAGIYLEKATGLKFLFWLCVLVGIVAAFLNIHRAFKMLNKELEELQNDPRYKNYKPKFDDDEDE